MTTKSTVCTVPPTGWVCSREEGHTGPCAASPCIVEMNVPVSVDIEDIAHALSREQAEQMIVEIDSAQCDVGFSEEIITRLCSILKPCYDSVDEYEFFLESLK